MARGGSIFNPRGEGFGPSLSPPPSRIRGPAPRMRLQMPADARTPKSSALSSTRAAKKFGIFCHGFAAVTTVAQTLKLTVQKQLQVTAVWDHMVNIRCPNTKSTTGAFTAERLAGQLSISPSLPAISWVRVQVMPGS